MHAKTCWQGTFLLCLMQAEVQPTLAWLWLALALHNLGSASSSSVHLLVAAQQQSTLLGVFAANVGHCCRWRSPQVTKRVIYEYGTLRLMHAAVSWYLRLGQQVCIYWADSLGDRAACAPQDVACSSLQQNLAHQLYCRSCEPISASRP